MTVNVVAEFGQTMRGDVGLAVDMVQRFAEAGATHCKVQMLKPETIAADHARSYWHTGPDVYQRDSFAASGLIGYDEWGPVREMCDTMRVGFIATPFDFDAVDALADLDPAAVKIASGDITFMPLLERIAQRFAGKTVLLSTGASTGVEIVRAATILCAQRVSVRLVPLACTLRYPAIDPLLHRIRDVSMLMRDAFNYTMPVGYSDHTPHEHTARDAVLAGASWLEKHVTPMPLDGAVPDDMMGLGHEMFSEYVAQARVGERLLGDAGVSGDELDARLGARRAARYRVAMRTGDVLALDDFTFLRPDPDGMGNSIDAAVKAYGKLLVCDVKPGQIVEALHYS